MSDETRTLVILRHAKAAWPEGVADVQRPLAERGESDAPEAGRWLAANVATIDHAVRSPALRARQTWELANADWPNIPETEEDSRLYGQAVEDMLGVIRELPDAARTVVFVGHNPDLSQLTSALTGTETELATAGIAVVTSTLPWREWTSGVADLAQVHTARSR